MEAGGGFVRVSIWGTEKLTWLLACGDGLGLAGCQEFYLILTAVERD